MVVAAVDAAHKQLDGVPSVAECSVVAQDVAFEIESETATATAEGCSEDVDTEAVQEVVQEGDLS